MSKKLLTADTQVYSNSEWTFTGKYDSRGYKIYRKVFEGTYPAGEHEFNLDISDVDRVWINNAESWYYAAGEFFPVNFIHVNDGTLNYVTKCKTTKTKVFTHCGTYLTGGSYQYYIVVECTHAYVV